MKKQLLTLTISLLAMHWAMAQNWVQKMQDPKVNFYEVQNTFEQEWGNAPYVRGKGWKQYKRWEAFMEPRVAPHGERHKANQAWKEHYKFQRTYAPPQLAHTRAGNWTALGPSQWQSVSYNPGNGRVNVIVEDPNNPSTLYAGVPAGGCWKSTDDGATWTVLTDNLPTLGVSAIVVDHSNSNIVYIGTGDGDGYDTYSNGVMKSTDGGNSWVESGLVWSTSSARVVRRMLMHPSNSNVLWAATNDGLYKTTDAGNSWVQTQSGSIQDLELKPGDPNTVYISGTEVYKSVDAGDTWTLVSTGLPNGNSVNRVRLAVSAANPDYVYYLAGDASDHSFYGLYRSTNSGSSFSLQSNSPNIFTSDEQGLGGGGQSWYDMALGVSPTNAEEVYVGGINVWKSSNGGTSWTILSHWVYPATLAYVHADIHTLDMYGGRLYCGSDGGLFRSTNGGNTWNDLSQGMEIMQFYRFGGTPQNANLLIGGAQDNGSNLYDGTVWTHVFGADGMEAAIDYTNPQIMYSSSQNGGLRRSNDGGQNFGDITGTINDAGSWVTPYVIDPVSPNILYGGFLQLWKTTDRGDNWSQISNFTIQANLRSIAVAPSNPNYIYTATYDNIYKTTDGGSNWSTITSGLPGNSITYIAVHPDDPDKLWVTLSGYTNGNKVMQSNDGGNNWINISGNLPNIPTNCIAYQDASDEAIYVGTDLGVYYKDSTLANWVPFADGFPNVIVNELEIHYGVSKIRAATYGRGLWESDLYTPSTFPPSANFGFTQGLLCQGEPIDFQDLSILAAPGWQWQFPGGTPSSSTDANPTVNYPSSGTYSVTLIVANANGNDTITQNVEVDFAEHEVQVNLQLDDYPGETTWEIQDSAGGVVASGGPYSGQTNQLLNELVCLHDGCYSFYIYDSYGDGICCGFGSGFYELLDSANTVLGTGGQFAYSDNFIFCFNAVPPVQINSSQATMSGCGASTGLISIFASGGSGNLSFSIDGGLSFQSNNSFSGLAAGTYNLVVQDSSGNFDTETVVVTEEANPVAVASASATTVYLDQGATVSFFRTGSLNSSLFNWDFGDSNTSSTPNPVHSYSSAGNYEVILTASKSNCSDQDTLEIVVEETIDVQFVDRPEALIKVIPNPLKERFVLDIQLAQTENVEIVIHNMLGQKIFWKAVKNLTSHQESIHFGNQADGLYIVTVLGDQTALSKKFIKLSR